MEASYESQPRPVQSSSDAEKARLSLEMQRRKIRQIHEELRSAEIWAEELEVRLKTAEMREKPPIMSFAEQLEDCQEGLEEEFVEETFSQEENQMGIISVLREKEKTLHQMNRSQLFGFVKTVLNARDCCLERDLAEGVETTQVGILVGDQSKLDRRFCIQEMASTVLYQLGSKRINWTDLVSWEAKILGRLLEEVEGVPAFMKRILQTFIKKVLAGQPQHFARVSSSRSQSNSTVE